MDTLTDATQAAREYFDRIRDAIKAGERLTTRNESATPETYAAAKADLDAHETALALREEGEREKAAADAQLAKTKAAAMATVKANPPSLDTAALDAALADIWAGIKRVREIDEEYAAQISTARETLAAGGWEGSWGSVSEEHPFSTSDSALLIDGVVHGRGFAITRLRPVKESLRDVY